MGYKVFTELIALADYWDSRENGWKNTKKKEKFDNRVIWLYNRASPQKFSIKGSNFREGVENIFKSLTSVYTAVIDGSRKVIPMLIIKRLGDDRYYYYNVYIFEREKKIFKRIDSRYP